MILSQSYTPRLAGTDTKVDPHSVTGRVIINGSTYLYAKGVLMYHGQPLAVSDDHDLIIDGRQQVIGAIVGGEMIPLNKLPNTQREKIKAKYGV